MKISPDEQHPLGYGFAWRDWGSYTITVFPVPFNFIARWARDFYIFLAKPRDHKEQEAHQQGYNKGFAYGKLEGYKEAQEDFSRKLGMAIIDSRGK